MSKKRILMIVALAAFLSPFTQTIYTPLLPEIQNQFHATSFLINLTISLYTFVLAGLQLIYGPLTDRYGRKRILIWGLMFYLMATLGCAFSDHIVSLLIFRSIQAVGMAAVTVVAVTVIGDLFEGKERGHSLGIYQMTMATGPVLGPVFGGFLGRYGSFHSVFFLLLFVSLLIFIFAILYLPETLTKPTAMRKMKLETFLQILSHKKGVAILLIAFIQYYSLYTYLVFLPRILTSTYHLSSSEKGLAFIPLSLFIIIGSYAGGRLQYKWHEGKCIVVTTLINALTLFVFIGLAEVSMTTLLLSIALFGLFLGGALPVQMRLLSDIFIQVRGTAVGLYNLFRYFGMGLGPLFGVGLFNLGGILLTFGIPAMLFLIIVFFSYPLLWPKTFSRIE